MLAHDDGGMPDAGWLDPGAPAPLTIRQTGPIVAPFSIYVTPHLLPVYRITISLERLNQELASLVGSNVPNHVKFVDRESLFGASACPAPPVPAVRVPPARREVMYASAHGQPARELE